MIRDRLTRPPFRTFFADVVVRTVVGNDTLREVVVDHCWEGNE